MASPLWQYYQDPDWQDWWQMVTGQAPVTVTPNYAGTVVEDRPAIDKPVGMTDQEVDYWTGPMAEGAGLNVAPRQVLRKFHDVGARRPNLYQQPRVARSIPLERGYPSGYGQEEGGMEEPYLGWRPTGTFLQTYPRLRKAYVEDEVVPPAVDIRDQDKEGPTKGIEAEEGPSSWWETALEMMQAAGQEMGDEKGTAFQAGGGTGQYPGPYMTGPATIMGFAPTYLRKRKKEERYE